MPISLKDSQYDAENAGVVENEEQADKQWKKDDDFRAKSTEEGESANKLEEVALTNELRKGASTKSRNAGASKTMTIRLVPRDRQGSALPCYAMLSAIRLRWLAGWPVDGRRRLCMCLGTCCY